VGTVGRQVVFDGEALVKVPREERGKLPLMRLIPIAEFELRNTMF
jgi:hypothetical protein